MPERFSASVAGKHMACRASANLELALHGWEPPVVEGRAATKGTQYHEFFANIAGLPAKDIKAFATAMQYVGDLRATRRFKVLVEQSVEATWLQSKPNTTADLVFYTADEIHVIDLKTGAIEVDVYDNEQLMYYAVCYAPLAPKAKGVTVHIVQPWAPVGCNSWFIDTPRLKQFMDEAIQAEKEILAGDTSFGPSDHCKFCPAFPHSRSPKGNIMCPATMQLLYPSIVHEDEILSL